MPKRSRAEKGKGVAQPSSQTPRAVRLFLNDLAADRFTHLSTRNTNSGRFVAIQDFEHLDVTPQSRRYGDVMATYIREVNTRSRVR